MQIVTNADKFSPELVVLRVGDGRKSAVCGLSLRYGDKEAADYLGCAPLTIYKLRKSRQITYYRYGRKFYFLGNELDEALKVPRRFGEKNRKGSS